MRIFWKTYFKEHLRTTASSFIYFTIHFISLWVSSIIWRAILEKIITFLCTKYFFDAASSCFCRHEILFCATSTFFWWHGILFHATSTRFCRSQITFCATSNFLLQLKIIFRATPNLYLCHGDTFLLSHSNKNIIAS